jgi:hypothetical protein
VTTQGRLDTLRGQLNSVTRQMQTLSRESPRLGSQLSRAQADLTKAKASISALQRNGSRQRRQRQGQNGKGVQVEVTGFEGLIEIRDVHLRHPVGFSNLIGIAVNTSGRTISYAELGCTFLDAHGEVLANGMDSKANWAQGASWGFDCGEQVYATGGILRVDEVS